MPFVDEPGRSAPTAPLAPSLRQAQPAPAPVAPPNPYDFTGDPLYQRILALGEQRTAQANAAALREQTQAAIDYGDTDLARSLGLGDAATAAAGQNPFSVYAKLAQNEKTAPGALDENLNKQNLFYSGARGKQQSELARSLLEARYNAGQQERGLLGGIETTRLGALGAVADQTSAAAEAAANRRTQQLGDLPGQAGAPGPPGSPATGGAATALQRAAQPRLRPQAPRPPRRRASGVLSSHGGLG